MASTIFFFSSSTSLFPSRTPFFSKNPNRVPSLLLYKYLSHNSPKRAIVSFALVESDSSESLDRKNKTDEEIDELLPVLQELAESFDLPLDYFAKLPRDLRLDLNDAAFDLANGPVLDECGQELGQMLLNLSRAWEQADTATSNSIAKQFPTLCSSLSDDLNSALGKRLIAAGRRFQSMGQYGQGEPQRIAKSLIKAGKLLSKVSVIQTDEQPKKEKRILKFGELQVELTPEKASIGAVIGIFFGLLSWGLTQGIQSIPESSLRYANDNALLMAKSLRGALLALGYSSTFLSAFACIGLLLLGRQLSSESKSKDTR